MIRATMSLLNPSQLSFKKLNFYYRDQRVFMASLKVFIEPLLYVLANIS